MEKEVKRGYVKWTDEDGVFHKEPLADHPDLLAKATPEQQLRAEEVRRLNTAAEEEMAEREEESEDTAEEILTDLKAAPEDVLTAAQLTEEAPVSAGEEEVGDRSQLPSNEPVDQEHAAALQELREATA